MAECRGEELIERLRAEPENFNDAGTGYALLQEYFGGFPVKTLSPLLKDHDPQIRRAAIWIASELGRDAESLLEDAVPLVYDDDRYIQYHALEVVTVCASGASAGEFVHVFRSLEAGDEVVRRHAMRLASTATTSQIEASLRVLEPSGSSNVIHSRVLPRLLPNEPQDAGQIMAMIEDEEPLVRRYGAILARRVYDESPDLLHGAARAEDVEIRNFAEGERRVRSDR
jgi:hypothetical protein